MIRWYKRGFQAHVVLHVPPNIQLVLEVGILEKFDISTIWLADPDHCVHTILNVSNPTSRNHQFVYPISSQWIVEAKKVQCPERIHGYYYLDDTSIPWQCMQFKDTPMNEEDVSTYTIYNLKCHRTSISKNKWDLQAVHLRIYE